MCVSAPKGPTVNSPRDTSSDPVVTKYGTPPELQGKMRKKRGSASLVNFGGRGESTEAGPSSASTYGGFSDAGGGFGV